MAVTISLRARLPESVLAEGYLRAICCPQVLWLRKDRPPFWVPGHACLFSPPLSSCLYL